MLIENERKRRKRFVKTSNYIIEGNWRKRFMIEISFIAKCGTAFFFF